jgi:hypothetical protein
MPTMVFQFPDLINESLQIGDTVYYCPTTGHGGFTTVNNANLSSTGIVYIGQCTQIINPSGSFWEVHVLIDPTLTLLQQSNILMGYNPAWCFIMFGKSTQANRNSLLGYYAEVTLGNDSPDTAELFMISTEASESSK